MRISFSFIHLLLSSPSPALPALNSRPISMTMKPQDGEVPAGVARGSSSSHSSISSSSSSTSSSIAFPGLTSTDRLPFLGLGTFQAKGDACYAATLHALKVGYRLIDTAAVYRNEAEVGRALRNSGVPREEVFITSKLSTKDQGEGVAYAAILRSLGELGLDYVDAYLIHWPGASGVKTEDPRNKDLRMGSYRDLQRAAQEGKIRHVGVSNFTPLHLKQLLEDPSTVMSPRINQVELHPLYQQRELRRFCEAHNILIQAYSSLGQADSRLREHPTVTGIAQATGRSPAQVLLRWALDQDIPVIPKSVTPSRIEENYQAGGAGAWRLTVQQREALDRLQDEGVGGQPGAAGAGAGGGIKFAWDPSGVV